MSGAAFMRVAKLKGPAIWLKAARHNRRCIQAELGATGHIDHTRSHLNITLVGPSTAEEVARLAKAKTVEAGITKERKNGVVGLELVFSLPSGHAVDVRTYFGECTLWAGATFGGTRNIVSADIHLDEAQDHAHVLVLPLMDGRLRGSDAVGNVRKLAELQANFFKQVAQKFGFAKPRTKLSASHKANLTAQVLEKMRTDPAIKSAAWAAIRDCLEREPMAYALALGISTLERSQPMKTMAQIFTGTGKGGRQQNHIGNLEHKPYRELESEKTQTLGLCRELQKTTCTKPPMDERDKGIRARKPEPLRLGTYRRMTKPIDGRGWLPAGMVEREKAPCPLGKKALKRLSTLPTGVNVNEAIQAARAAGLTLEELSGWAEPQAVARALACGGRPWLELWTLTAEANGR